MNTIEVEHPEGDLLPHVLIEPDAPATAAVIWLHGLGADGHDFEPIVPELKLPGSLPVRFIFPHAPERPVTINDGETMRAWYDFVPHSEYAGDNEIAEGSAAIGAFLDREIARGIPSERVILAGFSQGGVMALYTGLRYARRLAGILAISTYLHDISATERERHDANLAIPILMTHGTMDPMIPVMRAATARENLVRLGYDVRWYAYPIGHQVCLEEVEEFARFFLEILGGA